MYKHIWPALFWWNEKNGDIIVSEWWDDEPYRVSLCVLSKASESLFAEQTKCEETRKSPTGPPIWYHPPTVVR